jgi:hypothetical protein
MKSVKPKDGSGEPPAQGGAHFADGERRFHAMVSSYFARS